MCHVASRTIYTRHMKYICRSRDTTTHDIVLFSYEVMLLHELCIRVTSSISVDLEIRQRMILHCLVCGSRTKYTYKMSHVAPRNMFTRGTWSISLDLERWQPIMSCSLSYEVMLRHELCTRGTYCISLAFERLLHIRGVIVVSIVSGGGEVCIAYTELLVNSWDPRHILGYLYEYSSVD